VQDLVSALRSFAASALRQSSLWRTSPIDCPPDSDDYINAVVAFVRMNLGHGIVRHIDTTSLLVNGNASRSLVLPDNGDLRRRLAKVEALINGDYFSAGADFAASFSIIASRTPACSSRSSTTGAAVD
jgi:hypothetical protein